VSSKVFVGLARTVYIHTLFDRVFGDFHANNTVYIHRIHMVLANPTTLRYPCVLPFLQGTQNKTRFHSHRHCNFLQGMQNKTRFQSHRHCNFLQGMQNKTRVTPLQTCPCSLTGKGGTRHVPSQPSLLQPNLHSLVCYSLPDMPLLATGKGGTRHVPSQPSLLQPNLYSLVCYALPEMPLLATEKGGTKCAYTAITIAT